MNNRVPAVVAVERVFETQPPKMAAAATVARDRVLSGASSARNLLADEADVVASSAFHPGLAVRTWPFFLLKFLCIFH